MARDDKYLGRKALNISQKYEKKWCKLGAKNPLSLKNAANIAKTVFLEVFDNFAIFEAKKIPL